MNSIIYDIAYKGMSIFSKTIVYAGDTFINGLKNFYMGQVGLISSVFVTIISPLYSFVPGQITWALAFKSGTSSIIPNIMLIFFGLFQMLICPFSIIIRHYTLKRLAAEQLAKQKQAEEDLKKENKKRKKKGLPPIEFEGVNMKSTEFYSTKRGTPNVI